MTTLTASDGHTLDAYEVHPDGATASMVVIQEIFGVNAHIRSVADGYAAQGYHVIAPAMFDRVERGVELGYDADGIEAWSQGMVGLALTTGEWWLETGTLSHVEVRDQLADFIWHAFGGLVRERGADLSVLDG